MRRRSLLVSIGGVCVVGPAMNGCTGSGGDGEDETDRTKWVAESGGWLEAVTDEMIIYLARDDEELTSEMAALDRRTGEWLWTSAAKCGMFTGCGLAPTVADAIYLGTASDDSAHGSVSAIDADTGEIWWERQSGAASDLRVYDDMLFVSQSERRSNSLEVFEPETGETSWSHSMNERRSIPPISSNTVYLPNRRHLLGLDPTDGRERWRYSSDVGAIFLDSVIDDIAFCRTDNVVLAIEEGDQRWAIEFDEEIELSTFDSETLIVDNEDRSRLWGVDAANGDRLWTNGFPERISIIPSGDEYLLVGVDRSRLHRLNPRTGRKQWVIEAGYSRFDVTSVDERLYVVNDTLETLSARDIRTGEELWNRSVLEEEHIGELFVVQESQSTRDHSVYLEVSGPDREYAMLYQYGPSGDLVWSREFAGDMGSVPFEECLYVGTQEQIYAFELR